MKQLACQIQTFRDKHKDDKVLASTTVQFAMAPYRNKNEPYFRLLGRVSLSNDTLSRPN